MPIPETQYLLFWDTETNRKLNFKAPADAPGQARLVSLAWVLTDLAGAPIASCHLPIFPDNWSTDEDASTREAREIHGWTDAKLKAMGHAIEHVLFIWGRLADLRPLYIAHSAAYDAKVLRGECRRAKLPDRFVDTAMFCTMIESTKICQIPNDPASRRGGFKWPSLAEAYAKLIPEPLDGRAHNAMADVAACRKIFFALMRAGVEAKGYRTGQRGPEKEPAVIAYPILDGRKPTGPAPEAPKPLDPPLAPNRDSRWLDEPGVDQPRAHAEQQVPPTPGESIMPGIDEDVI